MCFDRGRAAGRDSGRRGRPAAARRRSGAPSFTVEGRPNDAGDTQTAEAALATPSYFSAFGVPLVSGRLFDEHDDERAPGAVVVSESFARRFFANENPIGRRIAAGARLPSGSAPGSGPAWLTIVGIVGDVRMQAVESEPAPLVYRSIYQVSNLNATLVVRSASDAVALGNAVRQQIRAVDPNEPVYGVRTMDEVVARALAQRRFTMLLLALFAVTALSLSAIGIYGVVAYVVTQRTHEIGIRMALGASGRDVLQLVFTYGLRLAGCGVAIGLAGALALTGLLSTLLYGISARDPATFVFLAAMLTAVAALACYLPARRAMRLAPVRALKGE